MQTNNEEQLKLSLAKAFPDIITIRWHPQMSVPTFWWTNSYKGVNPQTITDPEWLQVCWECEETLRPIELLEYGIELAKHISRGACHWGKLAHATWQKRAPVLVKLKGGEV